MKIVAVGGIALKESNLAGTLRYFGLIGESTEGAR